MTSPHKAIIFYNFNQSKQHNDTFTNLDRVVKLGCSGRIILENLNQDLSRVNDIKQLLGMSGYTSSEEVNHLI
ncbi:hypothetical protein BJ944DRAFT_102820 [Cunninghamella echinulata]|nr:hypothetical protein BJ944DRAFT_102820 [Cunninghamella echinulata]